MSKFSHLNKAGEANMVDVSGKQETVREAVAEAMVLVNEETFLAIKNQQVAKGDLMAVARVAGIQAAKKCSELIPLCHPLPLNKVNIDIELHDKQEDKWGVKIVATCRTEGKTGVEMEALTAASVSALTIYDMCKALDKGIVIQDVRLLKKSGGKSGDWLRDEGEANNG